MGGNRVIPDALVTVAQIGGTMSQKHFRALAEALKAQRTGRWDFEEPDLKLPARQLAKLVSSNKDRYLGMCAQWNADVRAIASVCKTMNPCFKYDTFFEACGGLFSLTEQ